jgi:hypothetical protein
LQIEIKFVGANYSKSKQLRERYSSALFNNIMTRIVSNYEFEVKPAIEEATYVIISDRMFESILQPFIFWKELLGYHVITRYTDEPGVGNTTVSITNYLKELYNNPQTGVNPPLHVLLVGDVDQIPSYDGTIDDHVTDLYYCEYTGDALPDVFYGRFSANTIAQLQPQIDKTLLYEKYMMSNPSYILNAVMVAGADASHATTYGNGQINYGTDVYFNTANGYTTHAYLQPEPGGGNYSTNIKTNITNGAGYVNYTAHCDPNGWSNPGFSVADIANLSNTDMYGLWVGNCCRSNRFSVNECFGEAALRAQNKGALGYIGATDYTYWDEDFWWGVGFKTVSANPVYDASHLGGYDRLFHTHGELTLEWYSTQGQMIFGGNLAVNESTSGLKTYYWEVYQLMGDPSVEIKTLLPKPIDVIYPTTAPKVNNNFIVAVKSGGTTSMLPDATVTLIKENVMVDSKKTADAYPDRGTAKFSFNLASGPMNICVSKSNYIPYTGTCELLAGVGELWISLHGGVTSPYEDWYENTGCYNYIINLEYHYAFRWAFVLEVAYNDFIWRDPRAHFPWWNISPTIRYYLPKARLKPFINCGPGFYIPDKGDNRLGAKIGLGLDYPISKRINIEIGTDFHYIFEGNNEMIFQNKKTSFQHFHTGIIYKLR